MMAEIRIDFDEDVHPPAPPPEFHIGLIDEVQAATGQQLATCCAACPLAHWEVQTIEAVRVEDELPPPGKAGPRNNWFLEAFCRVRHQDTARYQPNEEAPGTLRPANGTRLVIRCSDQAAALEQWQRDQERVG